MANVCPTGLFFETQPIEERLVQAGFVPTNTQTSFCLPSKKRGPALDLHANEEPQEEMSWPIKGLRSQAAGRPLFQHLLACAARLGAPRAPGLPGPGPRPTPHPGRPRGPRRAAHCPPLSRPYLAPPIRPAGSAKPRVRPEPGALGNRTGGKLSGNADDRVCPFLWPRGSAALLVPKPGGGGSPRGTSARSPRASGHSLMCTGSRSGELAKPLLKGAGLAGIPFSGTSTQSWVGEGNATTVPLVAVLVITFRSTFQVYASEKATRHASSVCAV